MQPRSTLGDSASSTPRYAAELRRVLPERVFQRAPARLFWLALHLPLVGAGLFVIAASHSHGLRLAAALVAGHSLGCLALLGHEIMHGSVVKSRTALRLLGALCMIQYGLLPSAWIAWHNNLHHGHTQRPMEDPDFSGTPAIYRLSPALRHYYKIMPGSGYWRSALFLFVNFSVHSARVVFTMPIARPRARRLSKAYMLGVLSLWFGFAAWGGVFGVLYGLLIPLAMSNFVMMSYIGTNHFLCPVASAENDPVQSSLTVRTTKLLEKLHLQFNYHTEHHIFPKMNPVHAPLVASHLKRLWPTRYHEMAHTRALLSLYRTPRLYRSDTFLVCPRTKESVRVPCAPAEST